MAECDRPLVRALLKTAVKRNALRAKCDGQSVLSCGSSHNCSPRKRQGCLLFYYTVHFSVIFKSCLASIRVTTLFLCSEYPSYTPQHQLTPTYLIYFHSA